MEKTEQIKAKHSNTTKLGKLMVKSRLLIMSSCFVCFALVGEKNKCLERNTHDKDEDHVTPKQYAPSL
jgi:hypothetical protein